jgi:hypothetical protein
MKNYISAVDTAKLIRKVLKREFPGQKFSVRTDRSINIKWTDGPTEDEVKPYVMPFEGQDFDGMIDMRYYKESWLLPDGSASFGNTSGTVDSAGADPAYDFPKPCEGAELVQFGADFIFTKRNHTRALVEQVVEEVYQEYHWTRPEIHDYQDGTASFKQDVPGEDWQRSMEIIRVYREALHHKSAYTKPTPSNGGFSSPRRTIERDRDWTWVTFRDKPAADVLSTLKEMGGRWSRKRSAWYFTRPLTPDQIPG